MTTMEQEQILDLERRVARLEALLKAALEMASAYPIGKILTKALHKGVAP